MRSPNYPAVGLGEAVSLAQSLWGKEKRSYAPMRAIVQAWGYAGLSGNARTKVAAMRKYGLLEENEHGDMRLSDVAVHILHNPIESAERLEALRLAALSPELFAELQVTYPQSSNETLRSYLITKKGFSDTGAENCIEAFRDTQETAKLGDMVTALTTVQPPIQPPPSSSVPTVDTYLPQVSSERPRQILEDSVTTFRWPLSRGVSAEVRFNGDVTPAHLDLLKQYLDVAKGAMAIEQEKPISHRVSSAPEDTSHNPDNGGA